ncbi:hypothetical protein LR48_Vigan05g165400 [Vigna angularis]|uniref:GIR1-like zinc ribbon domain-containing protein n=2 Tax=Phaseolus angularis TaxID=3914 RepID=A0A0L9UNE8_PHAAN|nr:uncharacterized protein HKW66_Vig0217130 [Vigna angularis]KOM44049.1 hypothetical protein LR48_Vigan05g165400 [Vigna angularis]BAT92107.1 hypothetical protein VIGAN_07077200 [Vigna angularis var. angularis]
MSNERGRSANVEFELSLSPPTTANSSLANPSSSSSSLCLYSSDPESCVSSETNEEIRSMLLVGCLRCLMYVLFTKDDPNPKCPRCKSTVLLHFLNNSQNTNKSTTKF